MSDLVPARAFNRAIEERNDARQKLREAEERLDQEVDHCAEGSVWQHRAESAEAALRDMEIERNMLRTVVGGVMETVVKAWDEGYGAAVSDSADVVQAFERRNPYRAALAGPSPTDEEGNS